jgi:hypothetical protein
MTIGISFERGGQASRDQKSAFARGSIEFKLGSEFAIQPAAPMLPIVAKLTTSTSKFKQITANFWGCASEAQLMDIGLMR